MGRNHSKQDIVSIFNDDIEHTCPQKIADTFANFFSTVGATLDLNLENNETLPHRLINRNP